MVPTGPGRAGEDTLEEQGLRGFWCPEKAVSWKAEGATTIFVLGAKPARGRSPFSSGQGQGERPRLPSRRPVVPEAPALCLWGRSVLPPAWAQEQHTHRALGKLTGLGKQVASGRRVELPGTSPAALRTASFGEIAIYQVVQLCKQVAQCFKSTFSCDFSQLKKWYEN